MIRANYHTHTTFCDGQNTAEEMVQEAIRLGFTTLGFSGHMDPDIHMDLEAYYQEISRLKELYRDRIEILCGIELDTVYDPAAGKDAEYIIGSTHFLEIDSPIPISVDNSEEMMARLIREYFSGDPYKLSKAYYELEAQVYDRLHCTFIGHFDLVTRFNDSMHFLDESDPRYVKPALETMEYLVSEGIPFEINCGAINRGRKKEPYPGLPLLKALKEFGGEILINSDAHQKELLNGCFHQAEAAALACGFTHINLLTRDQDSRIIWKQQALQ